MKPGALAVAHFPFDKTMQKVDWLTWDYVVADSWRPPPYLVTSSVAVAGLLNIIGIMMVWF